MALVDQQDKLQETTWTLGSLFDILNFCHFEYILYP